MFWTKRNRTQEERHETPAEPHATQAIAARSDADELERALDAVAALLHATGRFALDLPEQSALATLADSEQWAQHLLVRARRPIDPPSETPAGTQRDFAGAVGFATGVLREGQDYHRTTLEDFRHAIWNFVNGLHQALADDSESDSRMKGELLRLKAAAERGSTDTLKREAIAVAANIAEALEERREKQRSHSAELAARVTALGRQLEQAKREGAIDALTQICNRRAFDEHIEKAAALYGLVDQPICLVLIDIDHFKRVNDSYGHPMGDEVLRRVVGCLVKNFLRRDDFLARYGGEEFAVVLRDTRARDAVTVTARLLRAVRALSFSHPAGTFAVSVSAGVAQFSSDDTVKDWIARADRALYEAKNAGRDRVCDVDA